ncbi:DUF924 family protein [Alkalilacustris brevis]|uniref:DUF924 family protein n=1 Tax=Alkalilacustris brevis TaxID=2026338 RepID=UPI000E0D6E4C|nr:DUF924 family protein [Alkalilacustris brevis]
MPAPDPKIVLDFWQNEVGPEGWYSGGEKLDAVIRERFLDLWERGRCGGLEQWQTSPEGMLAYIILLDQFPRNMFRDDARAYATDQLARQVAEKAIHHRWDMRLPEPVRQFFYLPLMHSENRTDQDRCVRLILTRLPETGADNLLHARAHRAVIRQFGRFPHRNAVLRRRSTRDEQAYLAQGGYAATVKELREAA